MLIRVNWEDGRGNYRKGIKMRLDSRGFFRLLSAAPAADALQGLVGVLEGSPEPGGYGAFTGRRRVTADVPF